MPHVKTETAGVGSLAWLASDHGIGNARTVMLDISGFDKTANYPNGYIPSGTPLALASGMVVPYTSAEATDTGAGILAGHLLTDQTVDGSGADFAVPMLDHGRVKVSKVPKGTDTFAAPVKAAKGGNVTIVYI